MGESFVDILLPRRTESGILNFMTRAWNPHKTLKLDKYLNPQELKNVTANSIYLDAVIEAQSLSTGVSKEQLKREVWKYLDEMGLDRKMYVTRWLGVVFLKLSFMMKVGIYVNEPAVLNLRQSMGQNPVLFLPTHRSYADFCLMTYLCYHYDIDLPAVAAGMDFYSMAVVGRSMRDTCAFYIRRSLVGAPLYAATLAQYVRTIVAHNSAPIEFFVEGTRSRSNKSLPPKYGMLSMSLAALFSGEVSDVTIVPVNISYDRLMEHGLFAYEHLGVPKPKESTGGLLRAIYRLNQHFGNVYINMGEPFSAKQYLKYDANEKDERLKPIHLQQITAQQFRIVQDIADRVVQLQQKCTVVTISNLLSLVLMKSVIKNTVLLYEDVLKEVEYTALVLKKLGAKVFEGDVKSDVDRIMVVHDKMMKFDSDNKLRLISSVPMDVTKDVQMKMKGHILKTETMVNAVPLIQLQLYVNPVLHYLVPPAIVSLIVSRGAVTEEQLSVEYHQVRKLLRQELYYLEGTEDQVFQDAIKFCTSEDLVCVTSSLYTSGTGDKLRLLLHYAIWPSITTLGKCAQVLREQTRCEHKKALKLIQERVESSECHPYCLSLESISNCISGLVLYGAVLRNKLDETVTYEIVPEILNQSINLVNSISPRISASFGKSNRVIYDQRIKTSRL